MHAAGSGESTISIGDPNSQICCNFFKKTFSIFELKFEKLSQKAISEMKNKHVKADNCKIGKHKQRTKIKQNELHTVNS